MPAWFQDQCLFYQWESIPPKPLSISSVLLLQGLRDADNVRWLLHEKNNCSAALSYSSQPITQAQGANLLSTDLCSAAT